MRIHVRATRDQQPLDVECRREVSRRNIQAEPALHGVEVHRRIERRDTAEVPDVNVGTRFDQHLCEIESRIEDRQHKRRRPVRILQVDVRSACDQLLRTLNAAFTRGVEQRRESAAIHVLLARAQK